MSTHIPRIAIIGTGVAGLSAAHLLLDYSVEIQLYEKRNQIGGRSRAVKSPLALADPAFRLDYGQHALTGGHTHTLSLIRCLHTTPPLCHLLSSVRFPGQFEVSRKQLPAPFHWLMGFFQSTDCEVDDIWSAVKLGSYALKNKMSPRVSDTPLSNLCNQLTLSKKLITFIIEPLCLAALNTRVHQASANLFLDIIYALFFARQQASDTFLPTTDLTTLLLDPIANQLNDPHQCFLKSTVTAIEPVTNGFLLSVDQNGTAQTNTVDAIICATAAHEVNSLIGNIDQLSDAANMIEQFDYETIETLYLQYPGECRLPYPMIALSTSFGQWAFDLGQIKSHHPHVDRHTPGIISIVHSASEEIPKNQRHDLIDIIHQHFVDIGLTPSLSPIDHLWTIEKKATWRCSPGLIRPDNQTALHNFFLAGDYTEAHLPGTIEAAVISGQKAARQLLKNFNLARK